MRGLGYADFTKKFVKSASKSGIKLIGYIRQMAGVNFLLKNDNQSIIKWRLKWQLPYCLD